MGDRYIALVGVLQYWGYFLSHLARMGVGTGEGVSEGASSMQGEACEDASSSSMLGEGASSTRGEACEDASSSSMLGEGVSSTQGEACEDASSSSMLSEGVLSMLGEDA